MRSIKVCVSESLMQILPHVPDVADVVHNLRYI